MRTIRLFGFVCLLIFLLAGILTVPVLAESDSPEGAPAAGPPIEVQATGAGTPAEEEGSVSVAMVAPQAQSGLVVQALGDVWFFGPCPGGKCQSISMVNALTGATPDFITLNGAGLVYVKGLPYTENAGLDVNGLTLVKMTGLVWDGSGTGRPGMAVPPGAFINIHDFARGFTLRGFVISGNALPALVQFQNNTGLVKAVNLDIRNVAPAGNGMIIITQKGAVEVDRVRSDWNGGYGLQINNTLLAAPVKVTNSSFSHNGQPVGATVVGLEIYSLGPVTLTGVSTLGNYGTGAFIESSVRGVTVKNSDFSSNTDTIVNTFGYGLALGPNTRGPVMLNNVTASKNEMAGFWLRTIGGSITVNVFQAVSNQRQGIFVCADDPCTAPAATSVTLRDGISRMNTTGAFQVLTTGNILLDTVTAEGNGLGIGVLLDNRPGLGSVTLLNSNFDRNSGTGLVVYSNGAITASNIIASANVGGGAVFDNSTATSTRPVTISKSRILNNLMGGGLFVRSRGAVTLNTVHANNNSVNMFPPLPPIAPGLMLTLQEVTSPDGIGYDFWMINVGAPMPLTIDLLSNTFDTYLTVLSPLGPLMNDNAAPGTTNSQIFIPMAVPGPYQVIAGGAAAGQMGAYTLSFNDPFHITNFAFPMVNGVFIDNCLGAPAACTSTAPVRILAPSLDLLGSSQASLNGGFGYDILSGGAVTILNAHASDNLLEGMHIQAGGSVTITRAVVVDNNDVGIEVNALTKPVTMNTLAVLNNQKDGILIYNHNGTMAGPLTILNSTVNNNQDSGIWVQNRGSIILNGTSANNNGNGGVRLNNCLGNPCTNTFIANITISNGTFNNNLGVGAAENGLTLEPNGAVTLFNVSAAGNTLKGLQVDNSGWPIPLNFTLTAPATAVNNFSFNGRQGITVAGMGNITISRVIADFNNKNSAAPVASIELNNLAGVAKPVTLSFTQARNDQLGHGLWLQSNGAITLNTVSCLLNKIDGAYIVNNAASPTPKPVTILKSNFDGNRNIGLTVMSKGNILLNGVTVSYNGKGASLDNGSAGGNGTVTVLGTLGTSRFNYNISGANAGLEIKTNNNVVLNKMAAIGNNQRGILVSAPTGTVIITNALVHMNADDGMHVIAQGTILLNLVSAVGNGVGMAGDGVRLMTVNNNITILNSAFSGNGQYGVNVTTGPANTLFLKFSTWFGNNQDGLPLPDNNLNYDGAIVIL